MCATLQGILLLARKTGKYPVCFFLSGVQKYTADPVATGGFGDVYRGSFFSFHISLFYSLFPRLASWRGYVCESC
jgi:hypothetical protein